MGKGKTRECLIRKSNFGAIINRIRLSEKLYEIDNFSHSWMPIVLWILQNTDAKLPEIEKLMNFPIYYLRDIGQRRGELATMIKEARVRASDVKVRNYGNKVSLSEKLPDEWAKYLEPNG